MDALRLPAGAEADEKGAQPYPSVDDSSAGGIHGGEYALTSALALARYDARTSGDAPNGQLEVFLDEHFDNARMEHIYPNAKKVTKAE